MRGYHIRISLQRSQQYPYIPSSLFDKLPSHNTRQTRRKNAVINQQNADYRFGPIRIDWADLHMSNLKKEKKRGRSS
jgi:hypothetical protein